VVNIVVLARISFWQFKEGKRPVAFAELDSILNSLAKEEEGFRGYMSLLSYEDANSATILTLWDDEVALKKSEIGIFTQATNKVLDYLKEKPKIENCRVYSTQLFQRMK
jgi:heme-degrading monooxygenase HmoA